jgi:negative regulator of sigma-B (phosphoserine phosphatase)
MEDVKTSLLEWGVAGMPLPGFSESGDRHVFQPFQDGALVAVLDGLGHGAAAAAAAQVACSILESNAGENLTSLIMRCHEALRGTRGVAMSLASFNFRDSLMTWMGVGNVQGVMLPQNGRLDFREESLLLRKGVLGSHLPPLQEAVLPVTAGDSLTFTTDGLESNFDRSYLRNQSPKAAAESILSRYAKKTDDAMILVARYRGASI